VDGSRAPYSPRRRIRCFWRIRIVLRGIRSWTAIKYTCTTALSRVTIIIIIIIIMIWAEQLIVSAGAWFTTTGCPAAFGIRKIKINNVVVVVVVARGDANKREVPGGPDGRTGVGHKGFVEIFTQSSESRFSSRPLNNIAFRKRRIRTRRIIVGRRP